MIRDIVAVGAEHCRNGGIIRVSLLRLCGTDLRGGTPFKAFNLEVVDVRRSLVEGPRCHLQLLSSQHLLTNSGLSGCVLILNARNRQRDPQRDTPGKDRGEKSSYEHITA